MNKNSILRIFQGESAVGVILILATIFAMFIANSPLSSSYNDLMQTYVSITAGSFVLAKPLLLWINDGLMAVFFFMVGLEIKREVMEGSLNSFDKLALPAFAAVGGMIVPALIFTFFNYGDEGVMQGWAIPAATDIAFALGILSLLGPRVPTSLKIFLLALAIIDDLGAILIIAFFYTSNLSFSSLGIAGALVLVLIYMNYKNVLNNTAYILVGILLWTAVLKSGVHATLAGVILGLLIPLKGNQDSYHALEHSLHKPVNFFILPIFAFANAGIAFSGVGVKDLVDNLTLGILFGLFLGKQIGVFLFSMLAIVLKFGKLPEGVGFIDLYGVSVLSGIGFTMSLFIGSLAYECTGDICFDVVDERLGIVLGSLISGIIGFIILKLRYR